MGKVLPVSYDANKSTWMTSVIFEKWLIKWNSDLKKKRKKIALVIDNCPAHPEIDNLSILSLCFCHQIHPECSQWIRALFKT